MNDGKLIHSSKTTFIYSLYLVDNFSYLLAIAIRIFCYLVWAHQTRGYRVFVSFELRAATTLFCQLMSIERLISGIKIFTLDRSPYLLRPS